MDAGRWTAAEARRAIRTGEWKGPTAGLAAAYAQANLVALPREHAFDFLLFCQRNPRPCPLLEVVDAGRVEPGCADLSRPDYGDAVTVRDGEVPVFWACGVTPQAALLAARLPFAITHAPGHMLVTDLPCSGPFPGDEA